MLRDCPLHYLRDRMLLYGPGWGNRLGMDPVRLHAPNLIGLWEVSGKGLGSQGYRQRQGPKRRSDARVLSPVGILKCSGLGG